MTTSVDEAFKNGLIGKRQHKALKKHAEKTQRGAYFKNAHPHETHDFGEGSQNSRPGHEKIKVCSSKRWLASSKKKTPWSCHCPTIF
jgi:hypothetical protein